MIYWVVLFFKKIQQHFICSENSLVFESAVIEKWKTKNSAKIVEIVTSQDVLGDGTDGRSLPSCVNGNNNNKSLRSLFVDTAESPWQWKPRVLQEPQQGEVMETFLEEEGFKPKWRLGIIQRIEGEEFLRKREQHMQRPSDETVTFYLKKKSC